MWFKNIYSFPQFSEKSTIIVKERPTMLSHNPESAPWSGSAPKLNEFLSWHISYPSTKIVEDLSSSFCLILLTNQQTNKCRWKHNFPGSYLICICEVKGSSQVQVKEWSKFKFFLMGTWMSAQNFMAIHLTVVSTAILRAVPRTRRSMSILLLH